MSFDVSNNKERHIGMDLLITLTYIGMIVLGFGMVTAAVAKHVMDGSHRDDEGLHQ